MPVIGFLAKRSFANAMNLFVDKISIKLGG